MKTCGEVLVEILEAYGIDTVFGIPGVHTVELYRGLPATGLRHITPRHEQGAGFMADGYARACGRPAACFIITGPGMTNIATASSKKTKWRTLLAEMTYQSSEKTLRFLPDIRFGKKGRTPTTFECSERN